MASKVQKHCRVCGKLYTPCPDCEKESHIFHWRTVACSKECGKKYFKAIEDSRKQKNAVNGKTSVDINDPIIDGGTAEKDTEKSGKQTKRNTVKK